MKSITAFVALLSFILLSSPVAFTQDLIIQGGWLVQVEEGTAIENPGITIVAGKIHEIGNPSREDFPILRLEDQDYILPGLIDLHSHYHVRYNGVTKTDTVVTPKLFLANGVTTTFTAGDPNPELTLEFKHKVNRGGAIGPRILNSGPYFGSANSEWNRDFTKEDIYSIVDEWAEKGTNGFKAKGISYNQLKYLIERAHNYGLTVTAHLGSGAYGGVSSADAIELGIDRVEHFLGGEMLPGESGAYDEIANLNTQSEGVEDAMQDFIDHGVAFNATIGTYCGWSRSNDGAFDYWVDEYKYLTPFTAEFIKATDNEPQDIQPTIASVYAKKKILLKRYHEMGGRVTLGTDRPFYLDLNLGNYMNGFFIHREMDIMANAGISNADVLKIATINGAEAIGWGDRIGTIEVSKLADLMVIKGNPLNDIRNTRSVHTVIKGGVIFDSDEILKKAEGKLGPVSETEW